MKSLMEQLIPSAPSAPSAAIIAPLLFTPADNAALSTLPTAVRQEVDAWLRAICGDPITGRPGVTRVGIQAQLARIASDMGVSSQTARRHFDALRATRDWRVLINGNRAGKPSRRHSEEFIAWYQALTERNQRKSRPAHREFARRWRSGETIPGLDNSLPRHILPEGCTYSNMQRTYRPSRTDLTVMRVGLAAAAPYLARTFTSRAGLWPASHYMFDDLRHDNFVTWRNHQCRVDELDCLDVLSACKIDWGCKPRYLREDGTEDALKERYMRLLLAKVLFTHGYSERGTEAMAEHGTAAIREAVERLLYDRTGGLFRVRRSGITGEEQAVAGMMHGRGVGNFRFKAALESLRNLIHNELGSIPGQTGMDVDRRPERLHGELGYASDISKAAELLPPNRRALLHLPLLEYHSQFLPLLMDVYRLINHRDWHALEGWSECGFVEVQYRLSPTSEDWLSPDQFLNLPAPARAMLTELCRQPSTLNPQPSTYYREHRLSPARVWAAGRSGLKRLPAFVVGELLGPDCAREEIVEGAYFVFADSEISPSELRYESRVTDPEGLETELPNGSKWMVFCNPFDPDQLFVHDAKGRHIGIAWRDRRISKADVDAIQQHWHRTSQRDRDILTPVRKRHASWSRDQIAMHAHNARVISGAGQAPPPSSPEAKAAAQAILAPTAEPPAPEPAPEPAPDLASDLLNALTHPYE